MLTRVRDRLRPNGADGLLSRFLIALTVLSALLAIGGPVIGLGVMHNSDTLLLRAPWATDAPVGFSPEHGSNSDTVDATVPVRVEQRRRIHDGDLPLWSDLQAAGAPLASIPNSSAFSPMTLPWYVLPIWYAPAASKLLEMAVAGGFLFLFARRVRMSRAAAAIAALAYVNSGFQVVWTNWPQSHVGALIPALFWAVDRAARNGRARDIVPIALVSATMWFEGFPAVTLWAHTAAGAYVAVALWVRRDRGNREHREQHRDREHPSPGSRPELLTVGDEPAKPADPTELTVPAVAWWRRGAVALAGVGLGIGVAAVQLVPFAFRLTHLDTSYRADPLKIRDLPWRGLITMVVPDAFGNPVDKVYFADKNYVELVAFVGAVTLILAIVGAVAGRATAVRPWVRRTFLVGAAVALWLAFIGGPVLDAFQRIPVIGPNAIGRIRSLLAFALAVSAGVGVDALLGMTPTKRSRWGVTAGLAGLAAAVVGLVLAVAPEAERADRLGYFREQLVLPLVVLTVATVVTLLAVWMARSRGLRVGAVAALGLLLAIESVSFASAWLPSIERDHFYPRTDVHRFLAGELGHDRLAATGFTMVPGTTTYYDLRSITAHSLTTEPYADLLRAASPGVFRRNRTYPVLIEGRDYGREPILDRMGARFLIDSPQVLLSGEAEVVTIENDRMRLPAGKSISVEVPPGEMRGVRLQLHEPVGPEVETYVKVEVFDAAGDLVADGKRRVLAREEAGRMDIAVLPTASWAEADATGPWTVRVVLDAPSGHLVFGVEEPGVPTLSVVRPAPGDGLELVFTRGATVYRRTNALPRVRWAGRAVVVAEGEDRVEAIRTGLPGDVVVLSEDPPSGYGETVVDLAVLPETTATTSATVEVTEDSGDTLRATVTSADAGYLVVSDTIQNAWVAEVDGQPVELVDGDHAFVAVPVPAGSHTVELSYRPAGARLGATVAVLSLMALVAALLTGARPLVRRREPDEGASADRRDVGDLEHVGDVHG